MSESLCFEAVLCSVALTLACSLRIPDEDATFARGGASALQTSGGALASSGKDSGGVGAGGATSGGASTDGATNSGGATDSGGTTSGGATNSGGTTDSGGTTNGGGAGTGGASNSAGSTAEGGANGGADSGGASSGGTTAGASFDPDDGLVAHFAFDESNGDEAVNGKDPNRSASYRGTCTHPAGRFGTAVSIRNSATSTVDYVELPAGIFENFSALTLVVWVRDLSTARTGGRLLHFSRDDRDEIYFSPDDMSDALSAQGAHLGGNHAGSPFVDIWTTTPLTDKDWHQVAFTWSAARIELYIDGRSAGSTQTPAVLPSDLGPTSPNWLGRTLNDAEIALYAEIDDLRLYDRTLKSAEIAALYAP